MTPSAHRSVSDRMLGTVSVDCDTLEDYARGYGFAYEHDPNLIFSHAIPRFLELFDRHGVRATFFVIGRDLQDPRHRRVIHRALEAGHELANHSWSHPRELAGLPNAHKREELLRAHEFVAEHFGLEMRGFRAPCYDMDPEAIDLLEQAGYLYDSSVHPSLVVTLFDIVVWVKSLFRVWEFRENCLRNGMAPVVPYFPSAHALHRAGRPRRLIELPVTVWSPMRIPFYGTWNLITGMKLFEPALADLVRRRVPVNYHFHAVELLGLEEDDLDKRFACHPGMMLRLGEKQAIVSQVLEGFLNNYRLVTGAELADALVGPAQQQASTPARDAA